MGYVVSYDEALNAPSSEIALDSGEHVHLALGNEGLVIKLLARPGAAERILFQTTPATAAKICDGLFAIEIGGRTTPLQILMSAVVQLPSATAVETAFRAAARA